MTLPSRNTYGVLLLIILTLASANIFLLFKTTRDPNYSQTKLAKVVDEQWTKETETRTDTAILDLNGDGVSEKIVIGSIKQDSGDIDRVLIAYNHAGEMIGKSDSKFVGQIPSGATIEARPPNILRSKVLLKMSYIDDLGQDETMFFILKNIVISPVCKVEYPKNIKDCIFSTALSGINPQYLESDGVMDVFEASDKSKMLEGSNDLDGVYNASSSGRINQKQHPNTLSVDAIYIYNNGYFQSQHGYTYNKIFDDYNRLFSYWNKDIKLIKGK